MGFTTFGGAGGALNANAFNITRITNNYTASNLDYVIGDGQTVTLPSPSSGDAILVDSVGEDITVQPSGAFLIEQNDTQVFIKKGDTVGFVSDGNDWFIIDGSDFSYTIPDTVDFRLRMDEGSGSTLADDIGPNDATLNGGGWESITGATGGTAPDMDGNDDYWITDSRFGINNDECGACGWFRPKSIAQAYGIIRSLDSQTTTVYDHGWFVTLRGDEGLSLDFRDNGDFVGGPTTTETILTDEWYFYGVSLNGSTATLYLWDNDDKLDEVSGDDDGRSQDGDNYLQGCVSNDNYLDGNPDDTFAFVDHEPSESEFSDIWSATRR